MNIELFYYFISIGYIFIFIVILIDIIKIFYYLILLY
jgi:hypothetical protein